MEANEAAALAENNIKHGFTETTNESKDAQSGEQVHSTVPAGATKENDTKTAKAKRKAKRGV